MTPPSPKRRKIRKGTHSCWECRRRKIRCQFSHDDTETCIPCHERHTRCVSQEYATSQAAPPSAPDRSVAQRLGRLEELMEMLIGRTESSPQSATAASTGAPSSYTATGISTTDNDNDADVFDSSAATNAQRMALAASYSPQPNPAPHAAEVSAQLHALFPPAATLAVLAHTSPGASYVLAAFHSQADQLAGKPEPPCALATRPPADAPAALLAKRLLQLAICAQQLPGTVSAADVDAWVAAAVRHVTSNDDLVGSRDGLEALVLLGLYQSDAGHLRKAWLTTRRALSLAQLMGLDRRPAAESVLWFRIVCSDHYLSLTLGLSVGTRPDAGGQLASDAPHDRMGNTYTSIVGRIAQRNETTTGPDAYALTQTLDAELATAASQLHSWTTLTPTTDAATLKLQVRHFSLLVLLHLPYLLQGDRYAYNRDACMTASRGVLQRYLAFRRSSSAHRPLDYAALIAGMTLLLGHAGGRSSDAPRAADGELVAQTATAMGTTDRLCREASATLTQLLPVAQGRHVHLAVPLLGTVDIPADEDADAAAAPFSLSPQPYEVGGPLGGGAEWPCFTAELEDWGLQGVDASYWSMLNGTLA